jgi:hypothetical protein
VALVVRALWPVLRREGGKSSSISCWCQRSPSGCSTARG